MKTVVIGGSGHLEYAFQSANASSIVAYAKGSHDEDLSRLAEYQLKAYSSYSEMLSAENPDFAVINPHYYLNSEVLVDCLNQGIHCFVEKPIALNIKELDLVKEATHKSSAVFGTMMIHRYEPWFAKAFEMVKHGVVGEIVTIQAQKSYKMGVKADWMRKKAKFGGLIPWVGAHAIDWLLALGLNDLKVEFANQSTNANKNQGELESNATIILANEKITASVNLDYLRPESAQTHGDDRIRITGEKGIIEVMNQKVEVMAEETLLIDAFENQPNIFDHFVESINGDAKYRVSEADAFKLAELCISAEKMANQ
jgi:predicted dehydrogenase